MMAHSIEEDDAALAGVAAHDRQAFLALYDRYVAPIERYVAARSGSSDVEDVVSTIFTRALDRIHTYRPERGAFAAWLFTIARNTVVDSHRERARSIPLDPEATPGSSSPGPEALALAHERQHAVQTALSHLTAEQREALALRYAADLPYAAVAASLGKSEPAAKMLVQRGLQSLRRNLEGDPNHD